MTQHTQEPWAIYELEPIGAGGAPEAVTLRFYCCQEHAAEARAHNAEDARLSAPEPLTQRDYLPGTVCEQCGAALPE